MSGEPRDDDFEADAEAQALSLLAGALPPLPPAPAARDRLLAALRGPERYAPFVNEVVDAFGLGADALRAALARMGDEAAWREGLWPNSRWMSTPALAAARVVIAKLAPRSRIEAHDHAYRELTYVLDGELVEDGQRRVSAGELLVAAPGSRHTIAVGDTACVVVFGIAPR